MRARGKEVYIITAVVAVVLIVAWYFLLLKPKQAEISDLTTQVETAQTALSSAQQEVVRLEAYKKTAPQSRAEIVRLGKMIPGAEGQPSLIIELTKTAADSGVALSSITRGDYEEGTPYGVQKVSLVVAGRYFDLEDFLYRLEDYVTFRNSSFRVTGRLLQVTSLNVTRVDTSSTEGSSSTTNTVSASIEIQGYVWGGSGGSTSTTTGGGQ